MKDKETFQEYWFKGMRILACVEPIVLDAQFCLICGNVLRDEGLLQEALDHYERAEKGFLRAEERWQEILEKPFPIEFTGLKNLISAGYAE